MITRFALDKNRLTLALVVMIVAGGLALFFQFPRSEDPPIVIREAVVTAFYPGLGPIEMEQLVTRRIEEQIRTMPEIDEITSDSKAGTVVIHATLRDEYDDLQAIFTRLRNKMSDLDPQLPPDVIGPFVNDEFGLTAVATIALWADGFSMAEMRDVARACATSFTSLRVSVVSTFSANDEVVYLRTLTPGWPTGDYTNQLVTLVDQNVVLPSGRFEFANQSVLIQPTGLYRMFQIAATRYVSLGSTLDPAR